MGRGKWIALIAGGILAGVAALAVTWWRARPATTETKGFCLDFLAGVYGLMDRVVGSFRQFEIDMAGIQEEDKVLDLGCATGALTLLEKEKVGKSGYVAGIDLGPQMISRARAAAAKRGLEVDFRAASIDDLPFPSDTFDVVTSSLMVHHLPTEVKQAGFREVYRVLKPGGHYLIVDIPKTTDFIGDVNVFLLHLLSPFLEEARYSLDLAEGRVPQMLRDAGFREVVEVGKFGLLGLMPLSFIRARK